MKKHFALILTTLFVQQAFAGGVYNQLVKFNPNWKKYKTQVKEKNEKVFVSDVEYVQEHLSHVIPILQDNTPAGLTSAQKATRTHLIGVLDEYRKAGLFPVNPYVAERIPVFIDEFDTHCAVGYLMRKSGYGKLARKIARADNYAWVKDIKVEGVYEWAFKSGFTLEELKLIQGAYDSYLPNALILPNKYEIPQQPMVVKRYFENKHKGSKTGNADLWCYGEGTNGVLNGKWIQNYNETTPWIVGYYENGKRTGNWKEYYQGTNKLCRTEVWRNNKLNGVRKRFDREGNLIEEILFKDGNAICKTNFELADSLTYIRKPIDSNLVYTEVYTMAGALLASGHERIYNPDNLFWFQNIELTALNSIAVSASRGQSPVAYAQSQQPVFLSSDEGNSIQFHPQINLYGAPSLVTYKKEGNWIYYKEYSGQKLNMVYAQPLATVLGNDFRHFGKLLNDNISNFDLVKIVGYDSILVKFENDQVKDFYGFGKVDYTHLEIRYYTSPMASVALFTIDLTEYPKHVKTLGQYNRYGEKVGVWKHYDRYGSLYKKEEYLIPRKPEDEEDLGNN